MDNERGCRLNWCDSKLLRNYGSEKLQLMAFIKEARDALALLDRGKIRCKW